MGECVQIVTGGALAATPHCVRGVKSSGNGSLAVARVSHPCFIDSAPGFQLKMPRGCTREEVLTSGVENDLVPPLGKRWTDDGMIFGDFLQKTFAMYYNWSQEDE